MAALAPPLPMKMAPPTDIELALFRARVPEAKAALPAEPASDAPAAAGSAATVRGPD